MDNKEGYLDFISSESYKQQIDIWYRAYNISREKMELFHDFLLSLYELIEATYLGSDVLRTEEDQNGHFEWCWNKTINNFSKERIEFKEKGLHKDYFHNFYIDAYYQIKEDGAKTRVVEYIGILFDLNHKKSRSELDILTEVYKIFDQNLKR